LDLVHTHGLWAFPSVAALRWAAQWRKPLVVSPHGMLDPWAVRHSAWKKRIAGWLFESRHLRGAACLHALNDAEYHAIRAFGLANPVAIIPNGVDLPEPEASPARPVWVAGVGNRRTLLYLGRLHPKKGLTNLLHAWARVQREATAVARSWCLVIAGWDQGGHETELQRLVETVQLGDTVLFVGPQFDAQKTATLSWADAFILPSLSEGLPMAVLEAWAHRLPVLMTRQCKLPEGFAAGAAMEIAPDADEMARTLAAFLNLPEQVRVAMGERGRQLVKERFAWDDIASQMVDVYRWLAAGGERPTCVRVG
jgi:poly(glycerol-phosphate) alpha-glucosyltransferase